MALNCGITLSTYAVVAGQSPGCVATLTVYNPNASSVVVTGAQLTVRYAGQPQPSGQMACNLPSVPIGPGQTVVVPPLGTIQFGPMPVAFMTPANANSYLSQGPVGTPLTGNSAVAVPPQMLVCVGALVQGSDGSSNVAVESGVTVSYNNLPPLGTQGGFLMFSAGTNLANGLILGVI